jgi:ribonuclease P protein component
MKPNSRESLPHCRKKDEQGPGNEQENLSAEQYQAPPHPRLPGQNENQIRKSGYQPPPGQRPQAAGRLIILQCLRPATGAPCMVSPFSLPKSRLLTRPWEFKMVYTHGKRVRGDHFSLIYLPNQEGKTRLGISVHGVKSAVRRNRIKRIVREFFRHHQSFPDWGRSVSKQPVPGMDVVFAIRKGFAPDSPMAIARALRELLARTPFTWQSLAGN